MLVRVLVRLVPLTACLLVLAACGGGSDFGFGTDGEEPDPIPQDLRLSTDAPGAELSFVPQVCCAGNNVYAVWADRRSGLLDVYFNRSIDRGATWLRNDIRLNTDGAGRANAQLPQICCEGQRVYVVWYDERNGLPDIYFNRSLDGGATWLASDVRLDTDLPGTGDSRDPQIACAGSSVRVVWADQRNGNWDIYASRSDDGGVSWLLTDARVDNDDTGADSEFPKVAIGDGTVHVVWRDERNGGFDVYASRSTDGGLTWLAADIRLNDGTLSGLADGPCIAAVGENVYAVWSEQRSGAADVFFNRSANRGSTWLPDDIRLDTDTAGAGGSTIPDLCVAGDNIYVSWQDARNGNEDVYFNRSRNGGATWLDDDIRLDTNAPGASRSLGPRICCSGPSVGVAWYDDRNGRMDIYLSWSPDAGSRWLATDLRIDDDEPGAGHSITPQVCCAIDRVVVVWSDQRDGPGDVYGRGADFGGR